METIINNNRKIVCEDALSWLANHQVIPDSSFVASLPDKSEFSGLTLDQWKTWFMSTAVLIFEKTPAEGVAFFYQSDIKVEGVWVDKSFLIMKAAELAGVELLFHKIICRTKPGIITLGRPAYSHLLCFSKNFRPSADKFSFADVIPDIGEKTWVRGMGLNACLQIATFISRQTTSKVLINPFCGEGSMIAAANAKDLSAIGIERSPKRARKAEQLKVSADGLSFI